MKTNVFMTMAVAVLMLAGCGNEETEMNNGLVELRLTSGVEVRQTRTFTATQEAKINKEEVVSVWVDDAEISQGPKALYSGIQLTADGSNGFEEGSTPMFFPETGNKIDIYAIHGNFSLAFTEGTAFPTEGAEYKVEADQSGTTPANYTKSDLLYAKEKAVARSGNPTTQQLTFYHMLSKLELAIVIGKGGPELAGSDAVTLGGVTLSGKFTPSTGDGAMNDQSERAKMLGDASESSTGDMTLGQNICEDFTTNVVYNEAILVPQDMKGKVLTFKLKDGGTLKYTIQAFAGQEDAKFESGKKYQYHITLNLSGLTVTSKIESWDSVGPMSGTAEMENL